MEVRDALGGVSWSCVESKSGVPIKLPSKGEAGTGAGLTLFPHCTLYALSTLRPLNTLWSLSCQKPD